MNKKQPNVIVFFTDQQRWDTAGVNGNPSGLTPNLDRMAKRGTHFTNSFTCQPVCGPARSCLQTGRYATDTGCFRNGIPLPTDARTLAHYYGDAGYQTGYIGKWHLSHQEPVPAHLQGGYQYWLGAEATEIVSDAYRTILYDKDQREVFLPGYRVDATTDAAIRYVQDVRENPFFLFLSYIEPHHQNHRDDYPAPLGYEEKYRDAWMPHDLQALKGTAHQHWPGYCGMVKRLDEALGRLLDALVSMDLEKDTIILFTSDHGSHFKTRNGEYKRSCHDSSIRVPTVIQGPGFWSGGHREEMFSLIDIPPTLLNASGLNVPAPMQGHSFMPVLNRVSDEWQDDVFVQISESQVGRAVRTKRWKYAVHAPDLKGAEVPGASKYEEQFLYDLKSDPYELNNLIGLSSHRETADVLRERLLRRMQQAGEPPAEIVPAPERKSSRRVEEHEIHQ